MGHEKHHSVRINYKIWIISACIVLPAIALFWKAYPALAVVLAFLTINTLIEYHKRFTEGTPIDIEVLLAGTAITSAVYGMGWALILVAIGPLVAELVRGHFCEEILIKSLALFIVAATANILGVGTPELVFAIILGTLTQYIGVSFTKHDTTINNIIARLTALGFNIYLIVFILPQFAALG